MSKAQLRVLTWVAVLLASWASSASAQVLGIFRWQMQPYCNVVTFTVIQQGPVYQLTGSDNLCGAAMAAPATGTASVNPNGTISLGFSIVTPSGATAHVNATVTLPTVDGTWTDADGNGGPFAFNGPGGASPARPAPTRSGLITSSQLAASIFAGTGVATTVARSDHQHDDRYFTESETTALVASMQVVSVSAGVLPSPLTPQVAIPNVSFTTPRAGRLWLTMPVNFTTLTCSAGTSVTLWFVLDGVPITSSVQVRSLTEPHVGVMSGFAADSVPAGNHSIGVAIRCASGNIGSITVHSPQLHVLVFP